VTGGAGHLAGRAEPLVLEELVPEGDLLGCLEVVGGNGDGRQAQRRLGRGGVRRQRDRGREAYGDE